MENLAVRRGRSLPLLGTGARTPDRQRRVGEPALGGECAVRVLYRRPDCEVRLLLGEAWRIRAGDGFLRQAQRLLGADAVQFRMGGRPQLVADRAVDMVQSG